MQYVFDTSKGKRYRFPTHTNELIIDRAVSQASEVFVVILEPEEAPPPHKHDDTEQVFYILEGEGTLTVGEKGEKYPVKSGDVIRIPPSSIHSIEAEGGNRLKYLAIDCFTASRTDDEPTWDDHVRVMCREQSWDYNNVTR
ncbi:MAG: cupin domain-containing protein [Candidatus Latescibacteria bacterium]|jgi:mannose-6-phosphate isomerase-like protein (cupin superfamily)|nr:cupin domain-containing protein [Candidatus Latescibacterota bacterium]